MTASLPNIWRAEAMKFGANRSVLFLGVFATPFVVFLFGALGELFIWATTPGARAVARAPLITDMTAALGAAGNPVLHLFTIAAAATLFAGEYRWETWRYMVPRARRGKLIAAKQGVFAALAVASLLVTVLVALMVAVGSALLFQAAPSAHPDAGAAWAGFGLAFAASLLQLGAVAGVTALASIATRSLLGAVMIAFLFSMGQFVFVALFNEAAGDPRFVAAFPNLAGDAARNFGFATGGDPDAPTQFGPFAFAALAGWNAVTLALSAFLFSRQDLSQE